MAANLRVACWLLAAGLPATGLLLVGCGDDAQDGEDTSGGASAAGKGGSSAGSPKGGSSSAGGAASAGSGQGGMGGDAPLGGSSAGVAGEGGGGRAAAGDGGNGGGSGGGDPGNVEYRACELSTAVDRIIVYRIDDAAGTCTRVVLMGASSCTLGVEAGGWCLEQAQLSADVAACKMLMVPADPKVASSATGTISVSGLVAEIDVTLEFPDGGGLPSSVSVAVSECTADCMQNDCRP